MKIKTRASSGVVTVTVDTAQGRRTISTGCTDIREAKRVIKAANVEGVEILAKAGALSQAMIHRLVVGANITVEEAMEQWEEWIKDSSRSDRTSENHVMFARAWARDAKALKKKLSEIKEGDISKWINAPDGTKLASRRVRLAALRSLFRFCSIRQYITYDPTKEAGVKARLLSHEQKEPRKKTRLLDNEIQQVVTYLRDKIEDLTTKKYANPDKLSAARFWYCATIIGRYAGLRLGDICSMEWECIGNGKLTVHTDKHDARVQLPIDDDLAKGLDSIPINTRKLCFPDQDAIMRSKLRAKLSVQFGRILEACGIHGHSFHDLRHSYACSCKEKGIPTPHISKRLGHSDEETTEIYLE